MNQKTTEVLDFDELEKSFNASMESLRKAIKGEEIETESAEDDELLNKAKDEDMDFDDDAEESEDEEEEEDEEDEDEGMKKSMSIEEELSMEPEAEAAMDVAPFLKSFVREFDRRLESMQKSINEVTSLAKSIGNAQLSTMSLYKSQGEKVNRIAQEDKRTAGLRRLQKSRFDGGDAEPLEVSGPEVLEKSRSWLADKKIDLVEAGMIETRVNKGLLGAQRDKLDQKVAKLMKEAK